MKFLNKQRIMLLIGIIIMLFAIIIADQGSTGPSIAIILSWTSGYIIALRHKNKEE